MLLSVCCSARITASRSKPMLVSWAIASSGGGGGGGRGATRGAAAPPPLGALWGRLPLSAPRCTVRDIIIAGASSTNALPTNWPSEYTNSGSSVSLQFMLNMPDMKPNITGTIVLSPHDKITCAQR
eukprot:472246_1